MGPRFYIDMLNGTIVIYFIYLLAVKHHCMDRLGSNRNI
jgi:hypothetical protein